MAITKLDVTGLNSNSMADHQTQSEAQSATTPAKIDSLLSLLQNQRAAGDLAQGRSTLAAIQSIIIGTPNSEGPPNAITGDLQLDALRNQAHETEAIRLSTEAIAQTAEAWTAETLPTDDILESLEDAVSQAIAEAKSTYEAALKIYNAIATDDPKKAQALELLNRIRTARDYAKANGDRALAAYQNLLGSLEPGSVELRTNGKFYLNPDPLGRFVVNGTENNDAVVFEQDGDDVFYTVNHQRIYLDQAQGTEVLINLKAGDDTFNAKTVNTGHFKFKINGDAGDDTIKGSAGDDYIVGGAGNDTIYSEGGSDLIDVKDAFNSAAAFHDTVVNGSACPQWGGSGIDYRNAGEIEVIANEEFGSDFINPVTISTQESSARQATNQTTINGQQQVFDQNHLETLRAEEQRKRQEWWSRIP